VSSPILALAAAAAVGGCSSFRIGSDDPDAGRSADAGPPEADAARGELPAGTPYEAPESCGGDRSRWLGGDIYGHEDEKRSLNALIGVRQVDESATAIDAAGVPCGEPASDCCGDYSWCFRVNPGIEPTGSREPGLERRWGKCIADAVTQAFIDIAPMDPTDSISWARYGAAAHHDQPVGPEAVDVLLRLPATFEAAGGNTGGVHGSIRCDGAPAGAGQVIAVRALSDDPGPACGVQGWMDSATALGDAGGDTYYAIDYLAGGQCNAASQTYRITMDVDCGGQTRTQEKVVEVTRGERQLVDWDFP